MIREATLQDVPQLVAMGESFLAHPPYNALMTSNPDAIAGIMTRLIESPAGVVFVAVDRGGALTGMLGALCFAHLLSGEWIAGQLFWWVEPAARGGLDGMRLWWLTRTWARAHGAAKLVMHAPVGSPLEHAYVRRGGVPVEVAYQFDLQADAELEVA